MADEPEEIEDVAGVGEKTAAVLREAGYESVADLREAIGFSSFGVLLYYLVANLAALRLLGRSSGSPAKRRARRGLAFVGAIGCVVLVVTLPPLAVAGGVAVFALGALFRAIRLRLARPAP